MKVPLDPVTQAKLDAFGRRRRGLILARGVCAALAILLGAMTAVAVIDYTFVLPDVARLLLSGAGYAAVVLGVWYTCARLVLRKPTARELARFIEKTQPELREDLLSAVELGEEDGEWDSEAFRRILQGNVAQRVRDIRIETLLSWRRIAAWFRVAAAVVGVCVALMFIPGFRFDHLLLRSLLPMANLERISRVKVAILEPSPPDAIVPEGETIGLRVELSGDEAKSVVLETFPRSGRSEKAEMKALPGRKYESNIVLGRDSVEYRIRAGDALTRKYLLSTRARPEVAKFRKTYDYPAYTRRAPRLAVEDHGDLDELEGTQADLMLETNQGVKGGELRLEVAGKASTIKLEAAGPRLLKARVPIAASGTYRVHLVAEETEFENKFSPQYEIRSRPDLVPRVTIDEPTQDLTVPPDELVVVKGTAKDDLGLEKVVQMVKVNQGEWTESEIPLKKAGLLEPITRSWNLFDLKVQPGDRVTTKLVAVDLKGNRAESSPLHVTITSPGFDPQRLLPLEAKRAVWSALVALRDAAKGADRKVQETAKAAEAGNELAYSQALLNLVAEAEKLTTNADLAETLLKEALRSARAGREGHDLIQVGIILRRLRDEAVAGARAEVERASSAADKEVRKSNFKRGETLFRRAAEMAAGAEESYRDILSGEEAVAALNDLKDLARDQATIRKQAEQGAALKDAGTWARLGRRQGVAAGLVGGVEEMLKVLMGRTTPDVSGRLDPIRKGLEERRAALAKALAAPASDVLAGPSNAMQGQIDAALAQFQPMEQDLARRAGLAREPLARRADSNHADVQAVRREMKELADLEAQKKTMAEQEARAVARWKGARAQLEGRAGQEEVRRDQDAFWVSDASLASRALQAVLETFQNVKGAGRANDTLKDVEQAFRTLEAGHQVAELSLALRDLSDSERWQGPTANAVVRHPMDWAWMDDRMRTIPEDMKKGGLPAEAMAALQKAWQGADAQKVRAEMAERAAPGRRPRPISDGLEKTGAEVARVVAQIQPALEAARQVLRKLVPSLAERLADLAKEAERDQKSTQQAAQQAKQEEPPKTAKEANKLLDRQQSLDRQIEDVMAQLRRDANTQDLFTEQGRERARDADDAVAMLNQAPPKAEELLNEAAAAPQAPVQEHALTRAAEQQGKLAEALKTLAEHYANADKGKPEETRPELRKAEEALGIKEDLDKQYGEMERLAEMAKQSPEALMAALENALQGNEAMQRRLEDLARNALDRAEAGLQEANQKEQQAQKSLQQSADQQQKAATAAEQAKKIAEQARQMAKKDVPQLQQQADQAKTPGAKAPLNQAAQDLNQGADAVPQNFQNPEQAAKQLQNAAKELTEAAQDFQAAMKAEQQAAQAAQTDAQKEQAQSQSAQNASQQAQQAAQQAQQAMQQQNAKAPPAQQAQQAAQVAQQAAKAADQAAQAAQRNAQAETAEAQSAQQAAQAQPQNAAAQQAAQAEAAEAQAAQAAAQKAQAASQAAQKASESAQKHSQMAQQAAQQNNAAAAQQEAATTQQRAQTAVQAAQEAAAAAAQSAQAEAAEAQAAQAAAQQAQQAADGAGQAAQQAAALAQQAQQLAAAVQQSAQGPQAQLAQQAAQQAPIGRQVNQAASDIAQAARHMERLNRPEESQTFGQLAQGTEGVSQNQIPAAQKALAQAQSPAQAQPAVGQAQQAIQNQLGALSQARASAAQPPAGEPPQGALSDSAAEFMANALNALDSAMNGQPPGQQPGQPSPSGQQAGQQAAQQAMASAAQAQAAAMRQGRTPGQGQPGQQPGQVPSSESSGQGQGAAVEGGEAAAAPLPQLKPLKAGEWGKLPPRLARDLVEAQRENVSGEYRTMVETYFRVLAEKAREKK